MQTTNMIVYMISYVMIFVLSWISSTNKNHRLFNDEGIITQKPGNVLGIHLTGILWLGLVPMIQLNLAVTKVLFGTAVPGVLPLSGFVLIYMLATTFAKKFGRNVGSHGVISNEIFTQLTPSFFTRYFIIRIAYLFVYELWFRGFLLFECINLFGIPAAVCINVFLYTLLHIFKSKKEILACIPFGLIACFLSIQFNAVWPAIILHAGIAIVYELNIYRSYFITSKTVGS